MTHLVFGGSSGIGSAVISELLTDSVDIVNIDLNPHPSIFLADNWVGDLTDDVFLLDILSRIDQLSTISSVLWSVRFRHHIQNSSVNLLNEAFNVELFPLVNLIESLHDRIITESPSFAIVSSIASSYVSAQHFSYNIIKSSLESFVRSCAVKYGEASSARFNIISPGVVFIPGRSDQIPLTDQKVALQRSSIPRQSPVHVSELAKLIVFILSSQSSSLNGANIIADGGESLLDQYFVAQRVLNFSS
ncbi:SDR family oxidoreductase [Cyanobium sp. WAJ14-Wanaka]|uniref:SDR family oxidoreductase n=1 Tax=Cyanobium sp. WAJ14-Wanaka TaxID=2823725 RepID=UPI0020CD054D|nr:SDR family oxidoreductase [Cyanobium sp. WAJ14-Wanaka]MCP9775673.1 SDR family oxidoreductase [Cyanobium sp. WAJ14-Wanaka]